MQRNKKYGPLTGKREIHRRRIRLHRPRVWSLGPAPASWSRTSPLSAGGHLRLNLNTNSIRISKALERSLVSILKVTSQRRTHVGKAGEVWENRMKRDLPFDPWESITKQGQLKHDLISTMIQLFYNTKTPQKERECLQAMRREIRENPI